MLSAGRPVFCTVIASKERQVSAAYSSRSRSPPPAAVSAAGADDAVGVPTDGEVVSRSAPAETAARSERRMRMVDLSESGVT